MKIKIKAKYFANICLLIVVLFLLVNYSFAWLQNYGKTKCDYSHVLYICPHHERLANLVYWYSPLNSRPHVLVPPVAYPAELSITVIDPSGIIVFENAQVIDLQSQEEITVYLNIPLNTSMGTGYYLVKSKLKTAFATYQATIAENSSLLMAARHLILEMQ